MPRFGLGTSILVSFALSLLVGCQSAQPMDMSQMKPPPRAPELSKLDPMVGNWESSGEMKMEGMDKPMSWKGTSHTGWEADGRILMERMDGTMGGDKYSGVGIWTWDDKAKLFRTWWFGSMGEVEQGTAMFDESAKLWRMKSAKGEGTAKPMGDTVEWSFAETSGGLFPKKTMEMKGIGKRVK